MAFRARRRRTWRRGDITLEVLIAIGIISIMVAIAAVSDAGSARAQRLNNAQTAAQEFGNQMVERFRAAPWEQLTPGGQAPTCTESPAMSDPVMQLLQEDPRLSSYSTQVRRNASSAGGGVTPCAVEIPSTSADKMGTSQRYLASKSVPMVAVSTISGGGRSKTISVDVRYTEPNTTNLKTINFTATRAGTPSEVRTQ